MELTLKQAILKGCIDTDKAVRDFFSVWFDTSGGAHRKACVFGAAALGAGIVSWPAKFLRTREPTENTPDFNPGQLREHLMALFPILQTPLILFEDARGVDDYWCIISLAWLGIACNDQSDWSREKIADIFERIERIQFELNAEWNMWRVMQRMKSGIIHHGDFALHNC